MTETQKLAGLLALLAVIIFNSIGNLLLKIGAGKAPAPMTLELVSWQTLTGISCFALAVILYAWTLKHFPLHLAQSVVALQYILTIILAANVLGEAITLTRWIGIALIAAGLYFCSR